MLRCWQSLRRSTPNPIHVCACKPSSGTSSRARLQTGTEHDCELPEICRWRALRRRDVPSHRQVEQPAREPGEDRGHTGGRRRGQSKARLSADSPGAHERDRHSSQRWRRLDGARRARQRHFRLVHHHQRSASLDFGGARNPDGQGFAAFGRVISGMDVVRKIQAAPSSTTMSTNAEAQRLTRRSRSRGSRE